MSNLFYTAELSYGRISPPLKGGNYMKAIYEKARSFVYRNARPLDFARWRYLFEGGSSEAVLEVLKHYQNPDGGFGHGIEADCLNPGSAPLPTWTATTILRELEIFDPTNPIVAGIVRYLESGLHFDGYRWIWTVPGNNDYPHAPWMHYDGPGFAAGEYNPTAALAGWLLRVTGSSFARKLVDNSLEHFYSGDLELQHELPCYLSLYRDLLEVDGSSPALEKLKAELDEMVSASVSSSADKWNSTYCARPTDFVSGNNDPFYSGCKELADRERLFIASTQLEDGAWPVTWNWGCYPDDFAISRRHWQSVIIIRYISFLKRTQ